MTRRAVVLARGLGTRMRGQAGSAGLTAPQAAAARAGAKAMMPISPGGRPFLDYGLSALADAGCTEVCLVVAPEHAAMREYYTALAPPRRTSITFAVQPEPRGTADALLAAEAWAGADRFLVVNGDNLYPVPGLRALAALDGAGACLFRRDTLIAHGNIPPERVRAFALCAVADDATLTAIVEKPETDGPAEALVSMNCWVMPPAVFEAARSIAPSVRGELEIADAVTWLMRERDVRFRVVVSGEGVLDLSRPDDVAAVSQALAGVTAESMTIGSGLESAGLRPAEAERKRALLAQTTAALDRVGARGGTRHYYVPGRVEVLGKHTDYGGGRSLLCAAERGFAVSVRPRADRRVRVVDVVHRVEAAFTLTPDQPDRTHWQNYPCTVVRRLARNFAAPLRGVDLAFGSDMPRASGISSSTAFIVAAFVALADRNQLDARPEWRAAIRSTEELAAYLGAVENGGSFGPLAGDTGVGTLGGSQDHTAILCAEPGRLVGYRFSPVAREAVVPLGDRVFVVAASGITASKASETRDQYNRAVRTLATLEQLWQRDAGGERIALGRVVEEQPGAVDHLRTLIAGAAGSGFSPEVLRNRLDQFVLEACTIVPAATRALAARDYRRFGALVDESQRAAERWLDNQIPETVALAREARRLGAEAASAFGAGFGGSVWALVPEAEADGFCQGWRDAYAAACPAAAARAEFFTTGAGPAVLRL